MRLNEKIICLGLCCLCFIQLAACKGSEEKESTEVKGIEVVAGNPVKRKMTEFIDLNATTIYQKQEILRATFQGFIEKTLKNIGDKIAQGDLIYVIRTKEADASLNSDIQYGNQTYNGAIKILARTNGIMMELNHQTGDYVSEGDQLGVIVDTNSLKLALEVPFQFVQYITANNSISILLQDKKEISAKLSNKIPSIDPVNQTQKFLLDINPAVNLPANLNVNVRIPFKNFGEAIALPKSSVITNEIQSEYWVMKLINDSVAVRMNIKKGIEVDGFIQINEPVLQFSDRFIVEGAYGLPDTAHVTIQNK